MEHLFRIYIDILDNFIYAFLLFRITGDNLECNIPVLHKVVFLGCMLMYSIPAHIPASTLINISIFFLFIFINTYPDIKKSILIFIKYTVYAYTSMMILFLAHSALFQDINTLNTSETYEKYKMIIIFFLTYVFYVLYANYKKNRTSRSPYHIYFNIVIFTICLLHSYSTLYICQKESHSQILPLLFSTFIILIILCISLYDHFLVLIEENAHHKIQSEINHMQENYALQTEEALKELHSIRHDIKNHLIIIDGYAAQNNSDKIHKYIGKIQKHFTDIPLIESPSVIVSAILNEKAAFARQKDVICKINCDFPYLKVDDFVMTTILGNLLDNALAAASKCSNGWIHVILHQAESLLLINISNSHSEVIHEKDGVFISTKTGTPHLHGIGIRNVQRAVKKINGQMEISYTKDTFHVEISLPNYK